MANNRKEHLRYRYGICLNDGCPKCKSKEVQQIPARKEFECEECHKPLRECPPPKSFWEKYGKIIIGAAVVVIAAIIIVLCFNTESGSEEKSIDNDEQTEQPTGPEDVNTTGTDSLSQQIDTITVKPQDIKVDETNGDNDIDKEPKPIFGGAATLSADGKVITFNRRYNLDLKGFEDETLYLHANDEIRNFEIKNGCLIRGELHTAGGEERLLTGINERL